MKASCGRHDRLRQRLHVAVAIAARLEVQVEVREHVDPPRTPPRKRHRPDRRPRSQRQAEPPRRHLHLPAEEPHAHAAPAQRPVDQRRHHLVAAQRSHQRRPHPVHLDEPHPQRFPPPHDQFIQARMAERLSHHRQRVPPRRRDRRSQVPVPEVHGRYHDAPTPLHPPVDPLESGRLHSDRQPFRRREPSACRELDHVVQVVGQRLTGDPPALANRCFRQNPLVVAAIVCRACGQQ